MKKALSFLVAVVMVLAIFPASALADDAYYLWVGGVKVDSSNKDDVLNDGTVSFDPESNTLLLSETEIDTYSIEAGYYEAIYYIGKKALTVELKGRNVISGSDIEYSILSIYSDLTICGKGYLEATAKKSCIYLSAGSLTLTDCVLKLKSIGDDCIYVKKGDLVAEDCVLDIGAYVNDIWVNNDICLENCRGSFMSKTRKGIRANKKNIDIRNCVFKMECFHCGIESGEGDVTIEDSVLDMISEGIKGATIFGFENIDIKGSRISIESENGHGIGAYDGDVSIFDSQIKINALYNAIYGKNVTISGGEVVGITGDEDNYAVYVADDDGDLILEDDAVLEMYSPYGATNVEPVLYKGAAVDYGFRKDMARMNVEPAFADRNYYEYNYVKIHPEVESDPVTISIPVNTAADEEEENPDTGAPVFF